MHALSIKFHLVNYMLLNFQLQLAANTFLITLSPKEKGILGKKAQQHTVGKLCNNMYLHP
jgi:hypothetical protein